MANKCDGVDWRPATSDLEKGAVSGSRSVGAHSYTLSMQKVQVGR
jgi:hypothetical protein